MYLKIGTPFTGAALSKLRQFLSACGLDYDSSISFSVNLMENDEIIASASLDGTTLKCIAVSPAHQGEDLTARLLTELRREAFDRGVDSLMLFTKPMNQPLFSSFGFYPVIRTADCLLMENKKDGLQCFLADIAADCGASGSVGCIVANCNPFTLGHRYLIESAAAQCDTLHVFVLSEEKPPFPAKDRLMLAKAGCTDLKNVFVHPSGAYMVSSATFPTYFIKDKARVDSIYCELDIRLFGEKIAPALGVHRRFVGSEPYCSVTRFYNEQMKLLLPRYGVELIELPRCEEGGAAISASRVRALWEQRKLSELRPLVPETTYEYLSQAVDRRR